MGRFVSLVGIQRYSENASAFPTEKLAGQICQHIIGMAPTELGRPFSPEEKLEIEQKAEKERTDNEAAKIQEDKGEELNAGEEAEEEIEVFIL
jgi:hypothetical protein